MEEDTGAKSSFIVVGVIGNYKNEIGIAAFDLRSASLHLSQYIETSSSYESTKILLDSFDPMAIIISPTKLAPDGTVGVSELVDKFFSSTTKVTMARGCFDDTKGTVLLKDFAARQLPNLQLDNYRVQYHLCVAAAAATIKWVVEQKKVIIPKQSLSVTFNGSFEDSELMMQGIGDDIKAYYISNPILPNVEENRADGTFSSLFHGGYLDMGIFQQGYCQCCFAIVSCEIVGHEVMRCRKGSIPKRCMPAVQELIDTMPIYNDKSRKETNDGRCQPGTPAGGLLYIKHNGVALDSDYPFKGKRESPLSIERPRVSVDDIVPLKNADPDWIDYILNDHPIAGRITVTQAFLDWRGEGIFTGDEEANPKIANPKIANPGEASSDTKNHNHAILIIGKGEEGTLKYFLIKNSWGLEWGNLGYAKVKRDLVTCLCFARKGIYHPFGFKSQ